MEVAKENKEMKVEYMTYYMKLRRREERGMEKGRKEGMEKGRKEGREEGREEGRWTPPSRSWSVRACLRSRKPRRKQVCPRKTSGNSRCAEKPCIPSTRPARRTRRWRWATKIFLNSKGKREGIDSDLATFLDYIEGKAPKGKFTAN